MDEQPVVKSAIFVDFDNVYLGMKDLDPQAANIFATEPQRWLRWIEAGLNQHAASAPSGTPRNVLIRRCYLNPVSFSAFRPYFSRSGFSVVDCPPLTSRGKTSTDIHMVMDILDVLDGYEHVEEYVVLSADADFTPVLLRLRAKDKRTAIVTIGPTSAVYKASCDRVITDDEFVEAALALEEPASDEEELSHRQGVSGTDRDETFRKAAVAEVAALVAESSRAITLAELGNLLGSRLDSDQTANWGGWNTLKGLLRGQESGFEVSKHPPFWVFDPARHDLPSDRLEVGSSSSEERWTDVGAELRDLARRVHQVTGAPEIPPQEYAAIFEGLASSMNKDGYSKPTATVKAVRDLLRTEPFPPSRKAIEFVLKGIYFFGYFDTDRDEYMPADLADAYEKNLINLCRSAQMELSDQEVELLEEWLVGTD